MKLLDEKKRLFGVVNPVDLVAILLAATLILVLVTVLFGRPDSALDSDVASDRTVEIVILGVLPAADSYPIAEGQPVSRFGGAGLMGDLYSYETRYSPREILIGDELTIMDAVTTKDVELTVRGPGSIEAAGASIGAERVRHGQMIEVQLPYFQMNGRIISLREVE